MLFKNYTIVNIFVQLYRNAYTSQLECYPKIFFKIQL